MAQTKTVVLLVLLCVVLMNEISTGMAKSTKIDCKSKCEYRCSKSWKPKMCHRACNTCCERCNCVPNGPTASRDVCACYSQMKTHGGKYKCP